MLSLAFIIKKRKKKLRLGPYPSAAVTRLIIKQIITKTPRALCRAAAETLLELL